MRKKLARATIVVVEGFVRLPERNWDRYGADMVTPSALRAEITSAEV
jgi:hypothetical protein